MTTLDNMSLDAIKVMARSLEQELELQRGNRLSSQSRHCGQAESHCCRQKPFHVHLLLCAPGGTIRNRVFLQTKLNATTPTP